MSLEAENQSNTEIKDAVPSAQQATEEIKEPEEKTLRVILGKRSCQVNLPDGNILKVYHLTMNDLGDIEDRINIPITDWEKNPEADKSLSKIKTMIYIIWLALRRNEGFEMTVHQVGELFKIAQMGQVAQIVAKIFELSGINANVGNVKGTAEQVM